MSWICSCAGLTSGKLREVFNEIVAEKNQADYQISYDDVKAKLNLPEEMVPHSDLNGKARCGTCMNPFHEAIRQFNVIQPDGSRDFDDLGIMSVCKEEILKARERRQLEKAGANDNKDDGLCSVARNTTYARPAEDKGKPPVFSDNPIAGFPLIAAE